MNKAPTKHKVRIKEDVHSNSSRSIEGNFNHLKKNSFSIVAGDQKTRHDINLLINFKLVGGPLDIPLFIKLPRFGLQGILTKNKDLNLNLTLLNSEKNVFCLII